jgi:hypothetical protein
MSRGLSRLGGCYSGCCGCRVTSSPHRHPVTVWCWAAGVLPRRCVWEQELRPFSEMPSGQGPRGLCPDCAWRAGPRTGPSGFGRRRAGRAAGWGRASGRCSGSLAGWRGAAASGSADQSIRVRGAGAGAGAGVVTLAARWRGAGPCGARGQAAACVGGGRGAQGGGDERGKVREWNLGTLGLQQALPPPAGADV